MARRPFKSKKILIFAAAICIVAYAAFAVTASDTGKTGVLQATGQAGPYNVRLQSYKTGLIDQTAQTKRATLTVEIKNNTTATLQISPGLQMQLTDSSGARYNVTAKYLEPGEYTGGPLAPEAARTQAIDFEVPADFVFDSLVFQYDGSSAPLKVGL